VSSGVSSGSLDVSLFSPFFLGSLATNSFADEWIHEVDIGVGCAAPRREARMMLHFFSPLLPLLYLPPDKRKADTGIARGRINDSTAGFSSRPVGAPILPPFSFPFLQAGNSRFTANIGVSADQTG